MSREEKASNGDQASGVEKGQRKDGPIESINDVVGDWGKWQRDIFLFYASLAIFSAFNNLGLSLMSPKVDFWCKGTPAAFRVRLFFFCLQI